MVLQYNKLIVTIIVLDDTESSDQSNLYGNLFEESDNGMFQM